MTRRAATWAVYGGLCLLLVLILTTALRALVPPPWSSRISYNSEAYLFAVVLGAWVQVGLPRLREEQRMPWAVMLAVVWAFIGAGLLMSDLPSRFRTLNEAALALAVLLPYVTLARPLARRSVLLLLLVVVALVVWAVGWAPQSWVVDQAESLGLIFIAVLTFDVVDLQLLQPARRTSARTRWLWYGALILEPVIVSGLGTGMRSGDHVLARTLEFLGRVHESFFGMLLVALLLLLTLGGTHRQRPRAVPAGIAGAE